jgi:nucleoside-diphosphate-sugar epimerase
LRPASERACVSDYVLRVDRKTGREVPGPVSAEELLVHAHRDRAPVELAAGYVASRLVQLTGSEWLAAGAVAAVHEAARRLRIAPLGGDAFRFRRPGPHAATQRAALENRRRAEARRALAALGPHPRLRLLVTGATGFLGKELLVQAAAHPHVAEVVCVVRRERPGRPRTRSCSARERGRRLLRLLGIEGPAAGKFRFVEGDIEKRSLGLRADEVRRLARRLTHVVHCAASVAFDETFESSFRANVLGSRHALDLSRRLQRAARSPFVAHVAVETSYVHGRAARGRLPEDGLEFPARYYNNFYELTKALAALETDRALLDQGLRVVQILPSIVTGDSRTGNNRGDSKVVNAPINAFGRIQQALDAARSGWRRLPRLLLLRAAATAFPADRSAELNLVPVDRVVAGVLAALETPDAVGARIHLAADRRVRSAEMVRVMREELGVTVRMADPTLTRHVALPLATWLLTLAGEGRLARSLARLEAIFGPYSEWGQPVHGVGNDVRLLGLPARRPESLAAFRMACRHNRYVLLFGRVTDPSDVARRERAWAEALDRVELDTGRPAAEIPPAEFHAALGARLDLERFEAIGGAAA